MNHKFFKYNLREVENVVAWFAIIGGVIHCLFETLYHIMIGQFLPFLIVDYIAVAILLFAGLSSLKAVKSSAIGLLSGAWGFSSCLAYVTFFSFLQYYSQNQAHLFLVVTLGVALLLSAVLFILCLYITKQQINNR